MIACVSLNGDIAMFNRVVILIAFFLFAIASAPVSLAQASGDAAKCSTFVQDFYNYYLKLCQKEGKKDDPLDIATKERPGILSAELKKALDEDAAAAKKSPDEIVGLDFDPVLNSQDMGSKYVVGKVTQKNSNYLVEVFGLWDGKKNKAPDVVPEVSLKNGKCVFVNFRYCNEKGVLDNDLLKVLKSLNDERLKSKK